MACKMEIVITRKAGKTICVNGGMYVRKLIKTIEFPGSVVSKTLSIGKKTSTTGKLTTMTALLHLKLEYW